MLLPAPWTELERQHLRLAPNSPLPATWGQFERLAPRFPAGFLPPPDRLRPLLLLAVLPTLPTPQLLQKFLPEEDFDLLQRVLAPSPPGPRQNLGPLQQRLGDPAAFLLRWLLRLGVLEQAVTDRDAELIRVLADETPKLRVLLRQRFPAAERAVWMDSLVQTELELVRRYREGLKGL